MFLQPYYPHNYLCNRVFLIFLVCTLQSFVSDSLVNAILGCSSIYLVTLDSHVYVMDCSRPSQDAVSHTCIYITQSRVSGGLVEAITGCCFTYLYVHCTVTCIWWTGRGHHMMLFHIPVCTLHSHVYLMIWSWPSQDAVSLTCMYIAQSRVCDRLLCCFYCCISPVWRCVVFQYGPSFMAESNTCEYTFLWKTPYACPVQVCLTFVTVFSWPYMY